MSSENILQSHVMTDGLDKVAFIHSVLQNEVRKYEEKLNSVQKHLEADQQMLDLCAKESAAIYLKLAAVEAKVASSEANISHLQKESAQQIEKNSGKRMRCANMKSDLEEMKRKIARSCEAMKSYEAARESDKNKLALVPSLSTLHKQ